MIRIFLTGYMGAGKTTLGKAFAREMNVPFKSSLQLNPQKHTEDP